MNLRGSDNQKPTELRAAHIMLWLMAAALFVMTLAAAWYSGRS